MRITLALIYRPLLRQPGQRNAQESRKHRLKPQDAKPTLSYEQGGLVALDKTGVTCYDELMNPAVKRTLKYTIYTLMFVILVLVLSYIDPAKIIQFN